MANFLGGQSSSHSLGPAVLDGIDFDIRGRSNQFWGDIARFLTTPQCPFLDAWIGNALTTSLFYFVWAQFCYNPPCQYISGGIISNLENAWKQWTSSIPANKIFLGLPTSPQAAGSGFIAAELTSNVLLAIQVSAKYRGVTLWSRYYDAQSG
ncbi:hypothetical protein RJT34_02682 [Clitoria ternatea]|uniref:Uncharacterized protein n=1 Tax=Clitoria ternatea TaxID=43366 RepID=A0AAN9KK99_CLITE